MMCKWFSVAIAIALTAFSTDALAAKVLINIWDGSNYVVVRDLYNSGQLPNLKKLGALGQMTSAIPCFNGQCMHGVTKDQHATMLTGVYADQHGVWSNTRYQLIPNDLTIFYKLRTNVPGVRLGMLTGKCDNVGPSTFGNITDDIDYYMWCRPNQTAYLPDEVAAQASVLLRDWSSQPNWLLVVHFREPDETGHWLGVHSPEYKNVLRQNDKLLGDLVSLAPPDTRIFVLSDHGFGRMDLKTGDGVPTGHLTDTPSTFYVEKGVTRPAHFYIDRMTPRWLGLFGIPSQ